MKRKIRLVWDFYGETATGTAEHHVVHLKQFMLREQLEYHDTGIKSMGEIHTLAYLTVNEDDVRILRDALRPNRAFVEAE